MSEELIRERIVEKEKAPDKKDFSEEYVHSLREEAAAWRVKYRTLESAQSLLEIKAELNRRNIKVDPSWVKVQEGQSVELAIETFLKEYPHLDADPADSRLDDTLEDPISKIIQKKVEIRKAPKPTMPDPNSYGHESKSPQDTLKNRQLDEVKKDPEARALLRQQYRSMLASQGHRNPEY